MGVEIILYIFMIGFMIGFWLVLIANCVYDIRNTKKWDKKMQEQYDKIMSDLRTTETLTEVTADNVNLMSAIAEANLSVYETPTGKYILIPKEDK